jgi:hypothetical protein
MNERSDVFDDYEGCDSGIDTDPISDSESRRMMESSARDWEIICNKHFGTNDRVWSKDEDYKPT